MPNNRARTQNEQAALETRRRNQQQWLVIGVVSGLITVVVIVLAAILIGAARPEPGLYDQLTKTISAEGFPLLGDPNANVVIAEITDYNCVQCNDYVQVNDSTIIDSFIRNGRTRLMWVLTGTTASSGPIDQVALCAQSQGKFWQVRDALFAYERQLVPNQSATADFALPALQKAIAPTQVDVNQIAACVNDATTKAIIAAGQAFQTSNHLTNVPTLLWRIGNGPWQPFIGNDNQPYLSSAPPLEIIGRTIDEYYSTAQPGFK